MIKEEFISLDSVDQKILSLLQQDASITTKALARAVNLSSTPCWKRVQRLYDAGVIRKQVALVDPDRLGLRLTVFLAIRTDRHSESWSQQFANAMQSMPEIIEIHRMSGDVDYLLKAVVADTRAYDDLYQKMIKKVEMFDVTSMFVMEQIKNTTALPVG